MNKSKQRNYNMAVLGLLTAITFILINTPLGTISFGAVSFTIAHIPILIATLMFGLKDGLIMAFVFGAMSMARAFYNPAGVLDPLFQNPLISIVPRLMIPITTHYTYVLLNKFSKAVSATIAVIVGNITNTVFVFTAIYLIAKPFFESALGGTFMNILMVILPAAVIFETVFAVILTVPVVLRVRVRQSK